MGSSETELLDLCWYTLHREKHKCLSAQSKLGKDLKLQP